MNVKKYVFQAAVSIFLIGISVFILVMIDRQDPRSMYNNRTVLIDDYDSAEDDGSSYDETSSSKRKNNTSAETAPPSAPETDISISFETAPPSSSKKNNNNSVGTFISLSPEKNSSASAETTAPSSSKKNSSASAETTAPSSSKKNSSTSAETTASSSSKKTDSTSGKNTSSGGKNTNSAKEDNTRRRLVSPLDGKAVTVTAASINSDSIDVQDPVPFVGNALTYDPMSKSGGYNVRTFDGKKGDYDIYKAYVEALSKQPNLKITESYEKITNTKSSGESIFFSAGFNYTGSQSITKKTGQVYTDYDATVIIYGTITRNNMTFKVYVPEEMNMTDLGYRASGDVVDVALPGPSASAGLDMIGSSAFETSDGRLSTKLGKADVLRGGERYSTDVSYVTGKGGGSRFDVVVDSYYRNEGFEFGLQENSIMTGDIFTLKELAVERKSDLTYSSLKKASEYTEPRYFAAYNNDSARTASSAASSAFKNITVRVMYYEKDILAVYYVYVSFTNNSPDVEALAAVDLTASSLSEKDLEHKYTIAVGEDITLSCDTEFEHSYELFSWEIVNGKDIVSLDSTISSSCTVHGKKKGTATVRVTYNWGASEPDVLTNIPRTVDRSRDTNFVITVG